MKLRKNEKLVNQFGDTIELDTTAEKPYKVTFTDTDEIRWYRTLGFAQAAVSGHHNALSCGITIEWEYR